MARHANESLFEDGPEAEEAPDTSAPLAERMRPRTLEEFVGQSHLVGEGRVLRRVIEGGGVLPSLILWGAPGTGRRTLARLLARRSGSRFVALSAVFSGVKDLRAAISEARAEKRRGRRTILFIDEIHPFNKAQQDALLPAGADGILTLEPLSEEEVTALLRRALEDGERGLASMSPKVSDELLARIARGAGGDARVALAALEAAVEATEPDKKGVRRVTEEAGVQALGGARHPHHKGGGEHYNPPP